MQLDAIRTERNVSFFIGLPPGLNSIKLESNQTINNKQRI